MNNELIKKSLHDLDIECRDENESLFDLGLDSLLLVRLVMSLEKAFSIKLTKNFNRANFSTLKNIENHILSLQREAA